MKRTAVFLTAFLVFVEKSSSTECQKRWYTSDSFVCVCDQFFCDVIKDIPKPVAGRYKIITSSKDGERFRVNSFPCTPPSQGGHSDRKALAGTRQAVSITHTAVIGQVKITVNQSDVYQTMIGFGGSFTDATGINIAALSEDLQDTLLRSYFAPEGIEYSVGRIPIAGCDFSVRPYSYDDVPGDVNLQFFSLTEEDYFYKIPYIQKAMNVSSNPVLLFGSPWSPPSWMKENGMFNGTGGLLNQYYQTYANYLVKFVESYQKQNITIWGITPQNEPTAGYNDWPFNACGWTAEQMRDFIKSNLGPALSNANLSEVNLMIYEGNRSNIISFSSTILDDTEAAQYVDGIACHWYFDVEIPPSELDTVHYMYPNKFLMYTEACTGVFQPEKVDLGSWTRGEMYAYNIIEDVNHWSTGWVDWNMVLDLEGGPNWANNFVDSPVIINQTANEFYKQPMYYTMGHFSKFVSKGSIKIGSYQEDIVYGKENMNRLSLNISSAAFKVTNDVVLVLQNREETNVTVVVNDLNGSPFEVLILPKSINTIMYS